MPLYYDLISARRGRALHPWHVGVAAELLLAVRRQSYWERPERPEVVEFTEEDVTNDVTVLWAWVRQAITDCIVHEHFRHPGLAHTEHGDERPHNHMAPDLFGVSQDLLAEKGREPENWSVPAALYLPAKRDLEGFIGMRAAACRAKLDPDEVFGRLPA